MCMYVCVYKVRLRYIKSLQKLPRVKNIFIYTSKYITTLQINYCNDKKTAFFILTIFLKIPKKINLFKIMLSHTCI